MNVSTHSLKSRSQRGYMLLTLLLGVSLMAIAAAVIAPTVAMQIRRDREEEMIHRAAEYRRAVRRFTKQTGRFPMKLEDLESTNGARFLRKRYKDPITGKDFRVLRMAEIPNMLSANAPSLQSAANGDNSANSQESSDPSAQAPEQSPTPNSAVQRNSLFGSTPNSGTQPGSSASSSSGDNAFGGGIIIGVVSRSTKKTIREFNQKQHYNQWFFFYEPTFDRGFEVQGPTPLTRVPATLGGPQNSSGAQTQPTAPETPSGAPPQ